MRNFLWVSFLMTLCYLPGIVWADNDKKVDSLEAIVKSPTTVDTTRVLTLYKMLSLTIHNDPAKAGGYADQALALSKKIDYKKGMYLALLGKAGVLIYQSNFDTALALGREALAISTQLKNPKYIYDCCNTISTVYINIRKYDSAGYYFSYAEKELAKVPNNASFLAKIQQNLAVILFRFNEFERCIEEYSKLEKMYKNIQNNKELVACYEALGLCFIKLEKYDEAIKYYNLGLESAKLSGEAIPAIRLLTGIGNIYYEYQNNPQKALATYQAAQDSSRRHPETYYSKGIIYGLIGSRVELGQFAEAQILLDSLYNRAIATNDNKDYSFFYRMKGLIQLKQGNYKEASTLLEKAAAYALKIKTSGISEVFYVYEPLIQAYRGAGNYQKAFETQTLKIAATDSMHLANQQLKAEGGKWVKALDDEKLAQAVQIKAQAIGLTTQNRLMWLGVAVATATSLLMILAAVFFWRERQQKKRILILKREALHRVRNNFQTMTSLFDRRIRLSDSEESTVAFQEMKASFAVTTALFQKLEALADDAAPDVPLHESMQEIATSIGNLWKQPAKIDLSGVQPQVVDAGSALPVLLTLAEWLTNAFKYAFVGAATGTPEVRLGLSTQQGQLQLVVADNGRGLPTGFDWQTAQSTGTSLARTFAKQLKGSCSVLSASVGTVCTLSFPLKDTKI